MKERANNPDIMHYRGIDTPQLPNIEVYMDQLLTFFDRSYGFFRRDPKESVLTKAMINNYVKARIMDKPVKKKYSQKQIKKLILIYHLKQVLVFSDIQKLFLWLDTTKQSTDDFYEKFLQYENVSYSELADLYPEAFTEGTDSETLINTIISLSTEACAKKRLAEKLLDKLASSQ